MDVQNYFVRVYIIKNRTYCFCNIKKICGLSRTNFEKMSYWGFLGFKFDAWLTSFLMYSAP